MNSTSFTVQKLILPWPVIAFFSFIAVVVFVVEAFVGYGLADGTPIAESQVCTIVTIDEQTANVKIDCGGKTYEHVDSKLAIAYLKLEEPKPLSCTIFKTGNFDCTLEAAS
jgi:hypothetical protein